MSAADAKSTEHLLTDLQDADRTVVRRAVDALRAMAPGAPELAACLASRLQDEKTRWKWPVAYTLGYLGEASGLCLEVLGQGLGSEDQDVRWATQRLLTRLGGVQSEALELLLGLLGHGSPTQRRMAVYCLRDVGPRDGRIGERILQACQDPEPLVRVAAVTSLVSLLPVAEKSAAVLHRLINGDGDARVRNAARFVSARIEALSSP